MRLFVAIPLPEALADDLAALRPELPGARPVPAGNLHLTLAFLGEAPPAELAAIDAALAAVTGPAPRLHFTGLAPIEGRGSTVLAVELAHDPVLHALQSKVERALRAAGFELPRRRFRPHVTLARFRRPPDTLAATRISAQLAALGPPALPPLPVAAFCLFRSDLGHGPARYSELARYPIAP